MLRNPPPANLSFWGGIMDTPNLFSYATSELSQDAVISWLLAWSDPAFAESDSSLHECGTQLLRSLFVKAGVEPPDKITAVDVKRQVQSIDIVAEVAGSHVLAIEDKLDTGEHSNQLTRYRHVLQQMYPGREIALVYLKTGDQADYGSVLRAGWQTFGRRDLLDILRRSVGGGKSSGGSRLSPASRAH
jgi:hypothetical protein